MHALRMRFPSLSRAIVKHPCVSVVFGLIVSFLCSLESYDKFLLIGCMLVLVNKLGVLCPFCHCVLISFAFSSILGQ
jgi:hypothetical protein